MQKYQKSHFAVYDFAPKMFAILFFTLKTPIQIGKEHLCHKIIQGNIRFYLLLQMKT